MAAALEAGLKLEIVHSSWSASRCSCDATATDYCRNTAKLQVAREV
jgi:hypothetical protein